MQKITRPWYLYVTLIAFLTSCSTMNPRLDNGIQSTHQVDLGNKQSASLEDPPNKNVSVTEKNPDPANDASEDQNVSPSPNSSKDQGDLKSKDLAQHQIRNFHIIGKIAVQTSKQSGSANVNWTEHAGKYYIGIIGPVGVGAINLYGRKGKVILQTSNGKTFIDKSPEHLLAKGWGYDVPVSHLKYWIRGLPSPDLSMNTRYDNQGRLRTLIQQGWVIQYLGYTHRGKLNLPTKIFIHSPHLQVKIVIYQWQV